MTAIEKNLVVEQGATYILAFRWMNADEDGVPTTPKNLTGWLGRMQVRKTQQDDPLITATTDNEKIRLGHDPNNEEDPDDPTNGWVFVEFTDEDTDLFIYKSSKYDLELEDPSFTPGRVYRLLKGKVVTDPNITQEDEDPVVT